VKRLSTIFLTLLLLSGCTAFGDSPSTRPTTTATVSDVVPVPVTMDAVPSVSTVSPATTSNTATLIRVLDAAGCDFAGVRASKNLARKNSTTVEIACK